MYTLNFRYYSITPSNVSRPHEMTRKTSDLVWNKLLYLVQIMHRLRASLSTYESWINVSLIFTTGQQLRLNFYQLCKNTSCYLIFALFSMLVVDASSIIPQAIYIDHTGAVITIEWKEWELVRENSMWIIILYSK